MNRDELESAKKVYWVLWMLSLILAFSVMIYLFMFNWRIYGILALMSLMFGAFSLSRIVEYYCLSRVYNDKLRSMEFSEMLENPKIKIEKEEK